MFAQQLFNGIALGFHYVLIALGLTMVYGVLGNQAREAGRRSHESGKRDRKSSLTERMGKKMKTQFQAAEAVNGERQIGSFVLCSSTIACSCLSDDSTTGE